MSKCKHEEGRRRPPSRQAEKIPRMQKGTERESRGLTSSLVLLEHRVYQDMGRSDWRREEHLIDLAEKFGFYPECN